MKKYLQMFTGIRKKLILYYLVVILILGITSMLSFYNAEVVLDRFDFIITDYVFLNNLNNNVNLLMTELEKYLTTKSSDNLLNYYNIYNQLQKKSLSIKRVADRDIDKLMLKDIGNMIDNLLIESDNAVRAKRGRISSEYIAYFTRTNEISEHIKTYVNNLLSSKLKKGSDKYSSITRTMKYISYLNLIFIFMAVCVSIVYAIVLSYRITKPITQLSQSAEKISKGDFNVNIADIKTDDEINILAVAFNKMVLSIVSHIEELKTQAKVEKLLKEQEMQNLKMKSLLKDAELKSLQAQINPHFLFNTLNAASQLSMLEGADKSSEFIYKVAELFRYNLRKLDEPATLRDEIKYVCNYMFILKTRFGERIDFYTEIDESILEYRIPCTIIQPIVENAYIHGLQNLERKGEIHLTVKKRESTICIEVKDNGIGMEQKRIADILLEKDKEKLAKHVTGIGISNVIQRLKLYYNTSDTNDVVNIESKVNNGTNIILKIPYSEGNVR